MKTIRQSLVWGLIPVILLVAGCKQDTLIPNNHFFRIYETTPVPALGLDALPTENGYIILSQTYNKKFEYVWEGGSPLFIQTDKAGNIDYTNFWKNYNATENFSQPYPYFLSDIGDTVVRTIGYHRKNSEDNDKGCFISYNILKGSVDTCWENCPSWNLDMEPNSLLGAVKLRNKMTLVAKKGDNDNITFAKFDENGQFDSEYTNEDIYYTYASYVFGLYSKNSMYYTRKNNFLKIKENGLYTHLICPDEDGDPYLFGILSSFDDDYTLFDNFLPEDDWVFTDSANIMLSFYFDTHKKNLNVSFRYKGKRVNHLLNTFENIYKYKIFDTENFIFISVISFDGSCQILKINKNGTNFKEGLKTYSDFALGKIPIEKMNLTLSVDKIFEQNYGSLMEIGAIRELEGESPGINDLLICGTIYQESSRPRPFLMRVDEYGKY